MMKYLIAAAAFSALSVPAHAAVDLTTFTLNSSNGSASATTNSLVLTGDSSASGNVSGLTSFDWLFKAEDYLPFDDYAAFLTTSAGTIILSSVAAVGDFGSSGTQTYNFDTPYTGAITFSVNNVGDSDLASSLTITSVTSAAPEPGTWSLLILGFGLAGAALRRRRPAVLVRRAGEALAA